MVKVSSMVMGFVLAVVLIALINPLRSESAQYIGPFPKIPNGLEPVRIGYPWETRQMDFYVWNAGPEHGLFLHISMISGGSFCPDMNPFQLYSHYDNKDFFSDMNPFYENGRTVYPGCFPIGITLALIRPNDPYSEILVHAKYFGYKDYRIDVSTIYEPEYPSYDELVPCGNVDVLEVDYVSGWAYDPKDIYQSIILHIYIDKQFEGLMTTNIARTDLGLPYSIHGFSYMLPTLDAGSHTVEVYAINLNPSFPNTLLSGPTQITVPGSFLPQSGIWKSQDENLSMYLQLYQTGSCVLVVTMGNGVYTAFLDESYSDGINALDVDGEGYTLSLDLSSDSSGTLSVMLPAFGLVTTPVSLMFEAK